MSHHPAQSLYSLPPDLVDKVLGFLAVQELSSAILCCRSLRDGVSRRLGSTLSADVAQLCLRSCSPEVLCNFLGQVLPRLELLEKLDLSRSAVSDGLFMRLQGGSLPNLTSLSLVACQEISDKGVSFAAAGCPRLRFVDLTFCGGTTYGSAMWLREHCKHIEIVRRLPPWLQGKFVCPWGEVHTYYADGSFEFTRDEESKGFVTTLEEHDGFVQDTLQYINQPPWWPLIYRPGVLLKQIPGFPDEVLVAQRIQSLDPLTEFPDISLGQLQVGTTQVLEQELAMVSRMQVRRFSEGEGAMPPQSLTDEILEHMDTHRLLYMDDL